MKTLDQIGLETGTDKASCGHNYLWIYEMIFERYAQLPAPWILEVGIQFGYGLDAIRRHIPHAVIIGVDAIDNGVESESRKTILIGNAYSGEIFGKLEGMKFDIAIDDASHSLEDQMYFCEHYAPLLSYRGILIVEDVPFIDRCKSFAGALPPGFTYATIDLRVPGGLPDSILFVAQRK